MSRHEEMCPHCRAKTGLDGAPAAEVEPITVPELPEQPRVFRIHYPDGHARDYTLHPDGGLTMRVGAVVLSTSLDFAFMAETSWQGAHVEWDPDPLFAEAQAVEAVAVLVQESIDVAAA